MALSRVTPSGNFISPDCWMDAHQRFGLIAVPEDHERNPATVLTVG
jgi:hypothetical protein